MRGAGAAIPAAPVMRPFVRTAGVSASRTRDPTKRKLPTSALHPPHAACAPLPLPLQVAVLMSSKSALCARAALALLALAAYAAAQVAPLDCATLPPNWYQDSDDNDNGPWSALAEGGASSAMLSTLYSTLQQRLSDGQLSAPGWTACSSPTSAAAGCTQASMLDVAAGQMAALALTMKAAVWPNTAGPDASSRPLHCTPSMPDALNSMAPCVLSTAVCRLGHKLCSPGG